MCTGRICISLLIHFHERSTNAICPKHFVVSSPEVVVECSQKVGCIPILTIKFRSQTFEVTKSFCE